MYNYYKQSDVKCLRDKARHKLTNYSKRSELTETFNINCI